MHPVEIRECDGFEAMVLRHHGAYPTIGKTFGEFYGRVGGKYPTGLDFAIYHDDPSQVAEADLRSYAGAMVPAGTTPAEGMEILSIPGGRYIVALHQGGYSNIMDAWIAAFDHARANNLPLAELSGFEVYLNVMGQVSEEELRTEIRLKLAD